MKKIIATIASFSLLAPGLMVYVTPAVAAGSIYLSPGSGSVEVDQNITVSVRVNAGTEQVNSVKANLSYPTDKLTFVSANCSGGALSVIAECGGGSGVVEIGAGTTGSVTGDFLVGTVTFKGKAAGSASISFTSGTVALRQSDNTDILNGNWVGGSYSVTSPPPPPDSGDGGGSSGGGSSGGGSSTSGGSGTTTGSGGSGTTVAQKEKEEKDTTAPKISDIKVVDIDFEKATITWTTNEKSNSVVEFGIAKKLGFVKSNKKLVTKHKLVLPSNLLAPGTRIYYQVSSKDAEGNVAKSKLTSFKTRGYSVKIKIVNINNEPIVDTAVKIIPGFEEAKTDGNGIVEFKDVPPGMNSITVELGDQKFAAEFDVEETKDSKEVQEFDVQFSTEATTQVQGVFGLLPITIIVILSITVVILAWYIRSHHLVRKVTVGGGPDKRSAPEKDDKDEKNKDEKSKEKAKEQDKDDKKEEDYEPKIKIVAKSEEAQTKPNDSDKNEGEDSSDSGGNEPKMTVVRADDE